MIADCIIILIIVLFVILGARRGIARTVLNVVGLIITFSLAHFLSVVLSQGFYDLFIKENAVNNINSLIASNGIDYTIKNALDTVPDWVASVVSAVTSVFGGNDSLLNNIVKDSAQNAATASEAIESCVQTVVVGAFRIIFYFLLIIAVYLIIKWLIRLLLKLFDAPVIKQANKFCGGILGFIEGTLIVFLAANIFYTVMLFSNPEFLTDYMGNANLFNLMIFFRN